MSQITLALVNFFTNLLLLTLAMVDGCSAQSWTHKSRFQVHFWRTRGKRCPIGLWEYQGIVF